MNVPTIRHPQEDAVLTLLCRPCRSFSKSEWWACVCTVVSNSFATLRTAAHQAPLSMEAPRQEYWSGLPFPSPRVLPNPGIEPTSLPSPALASGFIKVESYNMNSFLSDLFYSAELFWDPPTFLHVSIIISFSFLNSIPLYRCITTCTYSFNDGHLVCFQFLTLTNKAVTHIYAQVFV